MCYLYLLVKVKWPKESKSAPSRELPGAQKLPKQGRLLRACTWRDFSCLVSGCPTHPLGASFIQATHSGVSSPFLGSAPPPAGPNFSAQAKSSGA